MQVTLSVHLTKVSLFPTSFTGVQAGLHSLYFLSLEMQRPVQHFIRDSFPQAVLPAEHSFSSIDTHLTLAYVQKAINGKKNKNKKTNQTKKTQSENNQTKPSLLAEDNKYTSHHFDEVLQKPSDVIMHPNHVPLPFSCTRAATVTKTGPFTR